MNKSNFKFAKITPPSLLVLHFKNQPRRSWRFWMKSLRSRFPNCQISYEDYASYWPDRFPFKMSHPHSSASASPSSSLSLWLSTTLPCSLLSSIFLHLLWLAHIILQVMGMSAEAQFHVLAVDDSLIDRMLIERLLKTSSFHGTFPVHWCYYYHYKE